MNRNDAAKIIVLFLVFYALLYLLPLIFNSFNLGLSMHDWGWTGKLDQLDYMFFLIPISGFFFMYFLLDWVNEYFETKAAYSIWMPLLLILISVIAYYFAISCYISNAAQLSGQKVGYCLYFDFDFLPMLLDSAFLVFVLAAVCGWASRVIILKTTPQQNAKK
ncbi:MAG: hypothetical protein V1494_02430 [Candidatus Diapherotrites archaeon]